MASPFNALRLAFFFFCLSLALVIALSSYLGLIVETWSATHWLFSYEHGFIKRGLIGTVYQYFQTPVSLRGISLAWNATALLVTLLLAYTAARTLFPAHQFSRANAKPNAISGAIPTPGSGSDNLDPHDQRAIRHIIIACSMALWILTGPGLIQQWFYDHGRFDIFAVFFLLFSLLVTASANKRISLAFILLSSLSLIVIHEAFFFWAPWVMIAIWLIFNSPNASELKFLGIMCFVLILAVGFVIKSNYSTQMSLEEAKAELSLKADFEPVEDSLMVQFRSSTDNLRFASRRPGTEFWARITVSAVILFPYFYLIWWFSRRAYRKNEMSLLGFPVVMLSPFVPMALFTVGIDYGRWLSMMNVGSALIVLAFFLRFPRALERFPLTVVALLGYLAVIQSSVGPFGVTTILPHLVDVLVRGAQ